MYGLVEGSDAASVQGAYTTLKVFSMTFENHLCAVSRIIYDVYSMSFFQDCLIKWLLNKSDFYIHSLLSVVTGSRGALNLAARRILLYTGQK